MAAHRFTISFESKGNADIVNITSRVQEGVASQPIEEGVATVFVPGATGALTTIEDEPGMIQDLKDLFENLAPEKGNYKHDSNSPTGNAHSHVRASLMGPSLAVPFSGKRLTLGQWQEIAFIDLYNRPRSRELIVQVVG